MEIGVNNYDPSTFLKQRFRLYFFKKDDSDEVVDPSAEVISGPQSSMLPSEYELMSKRLKQLLIASGEIDSYDLVQNSLNQDDFTDVEPSTTQSSKASKATTVTSKVQEEDLPQMRVNLINSDQTIIGQILLRKI